MPGAGQSILEETHLAVGAEIDVRVENGCILIKPLPTLQFDLDQLLEKILPENLHEESDFGPALGNETF